MTWDANATAAPIAWKGDGTYRVAVCEYASTAAPATSRESVVKGVEETINYFLPGGVNYTAEVQWPGAPAQVVLFSAKNASAVPAMLASVTATHGAGGVAAAAR